MNGDILYIGIILLITVFSVVLHELAHGGVAFLLGDHTAKDAGRLSLNPLKHIDPYMSILVPVILYIFRAPVFGGAKPVPINYHNLKGKEWGMAAVAISGPLTNFLIALVSFFIGHYTGLLYGFGGEVPSFIFSELILVNLGFMLFNLIPIPPLDGSRVLYAIAPDFFRGILANFERYGIITIYLLIFLFGDVFSGLMVNGTSGILQFFYFLI
ncbi:MAG: site-2 protease family protein [Candidatus Saccharibacteria bacterium]|nr:site-2 protease family protein [Candidatus Saccharibacteria bacterium]